MLSSPDLRWEILETKYGASKDEIFNLVFAAVSFLLLAYFIPVLFYTYPWTKDIGMNQTAIP